MSEITDKSLVAAIVTERERKNNSGKYLGNEICRKKASRSKATAERSVRKLTFHLLIGLLRELKPPRIPLSHNVSSLLLLHVGFLEALVLLPEGGDVGPQPPFGGVKPSLGLGGGSSLGSKLLPQLIQLSGIGLAGILLILQGPGQLVLLP